MNKRIRLTIATIAAIFLMASALTLLHHRPAAASTPIIITSAKTVTTAFVNDTTDPSSAQTPDPASKEPAPASILYVHVAGAVKKPWLYALPPGSRVMQAVKAAGGPAERADLDAVNLAEKVEDGEKIYIPAKSDTSAIRVPPGNRIGRMGMRPRHDEIAEIVPLPVAPYAPPLPTAGRHARGGHSGANNANKISSPSEGKININTGSDDQLERLPGVGPAIAARIMAYRQENHGFQKPEDLMNVSGIGEKKYAKIAPFVTI
jgi:competence protein ComEA